MSDIAKKEFAELALDGSNYMTWAMDAKINLTARSLGATITPPAFGAAPIPEAAKCAALHFLRHHLHADLKAKYLMEEDPLALWNSLKERYNQQKAVLLPEAQREWTLLRFQDFKTVAAYNSAMHKLVCKLRFCNQKITDEDMIDKTLGTFHPNMRVLQQQYRHTKYTKYSELINTLLEAEKHDELLMKNHNSRPTGTLGVPEAHANAHETNSTRGRGKGRMQRGGKWNNMRAQRGRGKSRGTFQGRGPARSQKENRVKGPANPGQVCYRCGCSDHWSRTCRTPKHLVELYMQSTARAKKAQ